MDKELCETDDQDSEWTQIVDFIENGTWESIQSLLSSDDAKKYSNRIINLILEMDISIKKQFSLLQIMADKDINIILSNGLLNTKHKLIRMIIDQYDIDLEVVFINAVIHNCIEIVEYLLNTGIVVTDKILDTIFCIPISIEFYAQHMIQN
jgi:hypothetical protein